MKRILGVLAILVVPSLFFGTVLGMLSGDWLISYLVWPVVVAFFTCLTLVMVGVYLFLDWVFD